MDQQILEYLILCPGAQHKGHPIQRIERSFESAAIAMDQLHEDHPKFDVILYEISKREVARHRAIKKPLLDPVCPKGCSGSRDGRPVVIRTQKGLVQCSICGYLGD